MKFSSGPSVDQWRRRLAVHPGAQQIQPVDQARVDHEPDHRRDRNSHDDDEETLPELVEMLDERRFFAVVEATQKPAARGTLTPHELLLGDGFGLLRCLSRCG